MWVVSIFFGIKIKFNASEYSQPCFYAVYNEHEIVVNIIHGNVMNGYMPKKQLMLILAWCEIYRDELMQNWEMILNGYEPIQIQGLRK